MSHAYCFEYNLFNGSRQINIW